MTVYGPSTSQVQGQLQSKSNQIVIAGTLGLLVGIITGLDFWGSGGAPDCYNYQSNFVIGFIFMI